MKRKTVQLPNKEFSIRKLLKSSFKDKSESLDLF